MSARRVGEGGEEVVPAPHAQIMTYTIWLYVYRVPLRRSGPRHLGIAAGTMPQSVRRRAALVTRDHRIVPSALSAERSVHRLASSACPARARRLFPCERSLLNDLSKVPARIVSRLKSTAPDRHRRPLEIVGADVVTARARMSPNNVSR